MYSVVALGAPLSGGLTLGLIPVVEAMARHHDREAERNAKRLHKDEIKDAIEEAGRQASIYGEGETSVKCYTDGLGIIEKRFKIKVK